MLFVHDTKLDAYREGKGGGVEEAWRDQAA